MENIQVNEASGSGSTGGRRSRSQPHSHVSYAAAVTDGPLGDRGSTRGGTSGMVHEEMGDMAAAMSSANPVGGSSNRRSRSAPRAGAASSAVEPGPGAAVGESARRSELDQGQSGSVGQAAPARVSQPNVTGSGQHGADLPSQTAPRVVGARVEPMAVEAPQTRAQNPPGHIQNGTGGDVGTHALNPMPGRAQGQGNSGQSRAAAAVAERFSRDARASSSLGTSAPLPGPTEELQEDQSGRVAMRRPAAVLPAVTSGGAVGHLAQPTHAHHGMFPWMTGPGDNSSLQRDRPGSAGGAALGHTSLPLSSRSMTMDRTVVGHGSASSHALLDRDECLQILEDRAAHLAQQMSRLEDLNKALERTDERSSDYARLKDQRDDLQEELHGLQRQVRQMATGGQSTNLLLESAARSLAAVAAKGSNSAVVAANTATPPLVDVDGKEHSGFLEKKKAAENLEFSTTFRRLAKPIMLDCAFTGHNFKIDIEKFRRSLERPRQDFTGAMTVNVASGMPTAAMLDRLKGIPAFESNTLLRRFINGRIFYTKYLCKEAVPPTDVHSLLVALENWELLATAVFSRPEFKGLFSSFRRLTEDSRYRFLGVGFWRSWIEQCMLDAHSDLALKYTGEMSSHPGAPPRMYEVVGDVGTYYAFEYLKARVDELELVLEKPRFLEHFQAMRQDIAQGQRTMEAKFAKEDQERFNSDGGDRSGQQRDKDRRGNDDDQYDSSGTKKGGNARGRSGGRGGNRPNGGSRGGRGQQQSGSRRPGRGQRQDDSRDGGYRRQPPSSQDRTPVRDDSRDRDRGRGSSPKRVRRASPEHERDRRNRDHSHSRDRRDKFLTPQHQERGKGAPPKNLCRQNMVFIATGKDADKCKERNCQFAHYQSKEVIPPEKLQSFLERARCTEVERSLFQRHFADTNDSRTPSGGAGGARP